MGKPVIIWRNWFYRWIRRPMFPIRCATFVELRLQQMGDFYEKPYFTMENCQFREAVKWRLKIFAPIYQKAHFYAKSGRTNRLAFMAVALFWHYTPAKKSMRESPLENRVVYNTIYIASAM